ncbi:MAG: ABC transporter ATP-binding protein [Bacteroidetes bacterium]|nr:ABC transporter ATP-binding protein [Bacteroidota bacterium]
MSAPAINISGFEKIYRARRRGENDVHALKPLTLAIEPGEVFGLLGPNGAGKTTLVKLLLGIVHATSGSATICGHAAGTTGSKALIGYLPENHRYPAYLAGEGVLSYFGSLSGMETSAVRKRSAMLLELVNMTKWRRTRVRQYSKGMMQRLGIAQALLNDPQVVFLDEPTDGVDPVGRREIRDVIGRLRNEGKTIFLNSHLLSEVELISDRVAILKQGEMVRIGTVRELTSSSNAYHIAVAADRAEEFAEAIAPFGPERIEGASALITADAERVNQAIDSLRARGLLITEITPARRSLEDLFMDIVGDNGGDAR